MCIHVTMYVKLVNAMILKSNVFHDVFFLINKVMHTFFSEGPAACLLPSGSLALNQFVKSVNRLSMWGLYKYFS